MNRGIYTAARGMATTAQWMDVISNNLANIGTNGYKADNLAFADVMMKNLYGEGGNGGFIGTMGNGPDSVAVSVDRSVGNIKPTGNPLDVAFRNSQGMFAIQKDGKTYYTRNGHFSMDSSGQLVNDQGYPVLDNRGSVIRATGKDQVKIDEQGYVHQGDNTLTQLGVFETDFQKVGVNLWSPEDGKTPVPVTNPDIVPGALEASNVEPVTAMVQLITVQRNFEMSQRSIQSQDDMTGKLVTLMEKH